MLRTVSESRKGDLREDLVVWSKRAIGEPRDDLGDEDVGSRKVLGLDACKEWHMLEERRVHVEHDLAPQIWRQLLEDRLLVAELVAPGVGREEVREVLSQPLAQWVADLAKPDVRVD